MIASHVSRRLSSSASSSRRISSKPPVIISSWRRNYSKTTTRATTAHLLSLDKSVLSTSSSSSLSPSPALHYSRRTCIALPQQVFRQSSSRPYSVFVSKYASCFSLTAKDIVDYCSHTGILSSSSSSTSSVQARITPTHVILRECPLCSKPTNNKPDNLYKLYISVGHGAYFCHRCGCSGSWLDWKAKAGGGGGKSSYTSTHVNHVPEGGPLSSFSSSSTSNSGARGRKSKKNGVSSMNGGLYGGDDSFSSSSASTAVPCLPMPPQRLQALYSNNLLAQDPNDPTTVLHYLTQKRGFDRKTLIKYGVGKAQYNFANEAGQFTPHDCVTFSWIMSEIDVHTQEQLRGGNYQLSSSASSSSLSSSTSSRLPAADLSPPTANTPEDSTTSTSSSSNNRTSFVTRRIKARALASKAYQRLDPPGGGWGFFGMHTIPQNAKEIVVTEGEYDAMAVWQATGRPAISLPNGCRSLPVSALPLLERFERIYLWMDNDGPGQEGAEVFCKKIGMERCYMVRPTPQNCIIIPADATTTTTEVMVLPKDANDALLLGYDLNRIIESSKLTPHERILSFDDLREDVLHEILNPDKYVGIPLPSLPNFTKIIRGLRRGELWVLTGPTGCGKTTILTQLSLDLAEQGVNVLWGSFEIKNTRLIHKMMQQYSREPLATGENADSNRLAALADRFGQLPLHFLKFHGGTDVDDVIDAMEYAVYVNDCQHIILDNMQFMVSRQSSNSSWDKFDIQDVAIEKFRKFATERNVHITLVMHPRKVQDNQRLDISSVYGSAKATQEADLVLIIQDDGAGGTNNNNRKFLDVRKNRFNGDLGTSPLFFDRQSGRFQEEPIINVKPTKKYELPSSSLPPSGYSGQHRQQQPYDDDYGDCNESSSSRMSSMSSSSAPQKQQQTLATVKVRTLPKLTVPGKQTTTATVPKGSLLDRMSSSSTPS